MAERIRKLNVNGRSAPVDAHPDEPLLYVLRDQLDLTGAKYGCGEGQCGACTVLVGDVSVRSCRTLVGSVGDRQITTIEGLASGGRLPPLQQAFVDEGALQCGYCTPGMIMSAASLLRKNARPSDPEIRQAMNGNICRCGTYPRIVAAVRAAAAKQEVPSGD